MQKIGQSQTRLTDQAVSSDAVKGLEIYLFIVLLLFHLIFSSKSIAVQMAWGVLMSSWHPNVLPLSARIWLSLVYLFGSFCFYGKERKGLAGCAFCLRHPRRGG